MPLVTRPWDSAEFLDTPKAVAKYLEIALEEDDPAFFAYALGVAARAKGMSAIAKEAGVNRVSLYQSLTRDGDPKLSTVLGVIKALGVKVSLKPAA